MALMTDERRKEMEEEMNRFEQEIALPGDDDSPDESHNARPPREHEMQINAQRRKEHFVPPPEHVISALPEVFRKGPPPPPPSSPPVPRLLSPPPPPILEIQPHPEATRFIPHQVNRNPQRPPMRPNFMGMRGPMAPPGPFPPPGHMGPYGPHGNQGPMMAGPHMFPDNHMHHMQHGLPLPPSMQHQMGNMGGSLPMPPGFHHPAPAPHIQRDSHFMPRAMQNQQYNSPVSVSSSNNETSAPIVTAAPAVYAAPFMKSHAENISETFSSANGQFQNMPITVQPSVQKVEKAPISKPVEEITSVAIPSVAIPEEAIVSRKKEKKKKIVRMAGGQAWEDNSLQEWETDDFRIFCGDLGNDVTDEVLIRAFSKYTSFVKAKVIRDKRTNKTKGYGFVSFKDPQDFIKAMREMNGRYVGSRPIKLRKSTWRDRNIDIVKKKQKEKEKLGLL